MPRVKKNKGDAHIARMEARGLGPSKRSSRQQQQRLDKGDAAYKQKKGDWGASSTYVTENFTLPLKEIRSLATNVPRQTTIMSILNHLAQWVYGRPNLNACLGSTQGDLHIKECKKYRTRVYLMQHLPDVESLRQAKSIISHASGRGIDIKLM